MKLSGIGERFRRFFQGQDTARACLVFCGLLWAVAIWHALDYSNEFDTEFPGLARDNYSRFAPFAYRLAEPGDTLDLTTLYLSTAGLVLSAAILRRSRSLHRSARAAALLQTCVGLCLAGFWVGSAPDPTPDGWHGLAWQAMLRMSTPPATRILLGLVAVGIVGLIITPLVRQGRPLYHAASRPWRWLSLLCGLGFAWRLTGWPDPEPWGYWTRWAMISSMSIVLAALISQWKQLEPATMAPTGRKRRLQNGFAAVGLALLLVQGGYYIHWLHWPIPRFKVIIPGQLYVSAMPPPQGLALAAQRHHFKTIINLFNEDTPQRHPNFPKELAYAQSHGIRYVRAEGKSYGAAFVESTLNEARNPANWPVLVHCHGNMDRTPAWLGIYRFIDQGWSMTDVLLAIERHRGYRPKGGTTMLYSDVLPVLAPERWATDPAGRRLAAHASDYRATAEPDALVTKPQENLRK